MPNTPAIGLPIKPFRFVDLFAGLGGFHIALKNLGGTCVFAAEWQEHLRVLYETNHGIRPEGDITLVELEDIPDHDVLTAGFPCQPFSKAGEQLGFKCTTQGNLLFNIVAILNYKKPKFFILENVPNLVSHDEGRTWGNILKELGSAGLGYHLKTKKLSPHHFGIPQIRERVYIIGALEPFSDNFTWPLTSDADTSITTVLDDHPAEAKKLSAQVLDCLNVWDSFLKRCPEGVELPSFPLWSMEWGATYPFEDETPYAQKKLLGADGLLTYKGSHGRSLSDIRGLDAQWAALPSHARTEQIKFPKWKKDFIRRNRAFYADNKEWIDPWMSNVLRFPSSLQKLEWNVKGGNRDIWQYILQFRASGVRVKRRTTAPSLIAMTETQVPIIGWQKRYMTPKECAKLQSLERLKQLPDTPTKAFHALGNAVNSRVVERVASALLNGTSPAGNTQVEKINRMDLYMSVKPPITWFGGKSRLAPKIIQHFAKHQTYCEPFGGSGAVLLAKSPSNVEVYNDVNGDLVNLFCVLRNPTLSKQLHAYLEDTFYALDEFDLAKEHTDEPVERARRFMVRQRQSYGGLGKKWSYSIKNSVGGKASTIRRWDIGLERLPLVHKRFKDVQIVRDDWRKVISTFDERETLFYLDPPYVPDTRINGQYSNELTQNDHHELVDYLLTELKGMVVLSGYDHESYRPLENAGWVRKNYDVPAHTSDSRGRRTECLWLSPSISAAVKFEVGNIAQGDLFISPTQRMQQGAYQTHQIRVESTEAKLIYTIRKMRQSGQRVTKRAVASQARMSREHLGRKYKHLFQM